MENKAGLLFSTKQHLLLTPLLEIQGILPLKSLTRVPGMKSWLKGLASYQSEIFPVTDLAQFILNTPSDCTKDSRILVVSLQESKVGLLVERVHEMLRFTQQTFAEESLQDGGEFSSYMIGAHMHQQRKIPIISCQLIVNSHNFVDVMES